MAAAAGDATAAPPTPRRGASKEARATKFTLLLLAFEVLVILCYAFTADYDSSLQASNTASDGGMGFYYPMYQDIHVMIFIGFGFLMTFLHTFSWSAVGMNFLLSAMAVQWGILTVEFFHRAYLGNWDVINMDIKLLIGGDFAAGALMISFGAVLGKVSATQLVVMTFCEMIVYGINETMVIHRLHAIDMGGSMVIHAFGAYFGLAVAWMIGNPAEGKAAPAFTKWSTTVAMVGTVFLWCYWPSFNCALAQGGQQHRVVLNTVLSISASCVAAFFASRLLRPGKKFDFEELQNATLAGGVAVGSSADLVIRPWGALLLGNVAGIISTLGFVYGSGLLLKYLRIHDTCGVHNLHGMPGVLGGIAGAVSAALAGDSAYGHAIDTIFHNRAPPPDGAGWSAATQGAYQFAGLLTSVAFGIAGGIATGAIIKLPFCDPMTDHFYQDVGEWSMHLDADQTGKTEHDVEEVLPLASPSSPAAPTHAADIELTPAGGADALAKLVSAEVGRQLVARGTPSTA